MVGAGFSVPFAPKTRLNALQHTFQNLEGNPVEFPDLYNFQSIEQRRWAGTYRPVCSCFSSLVSSQY